MTKTPIVHPSDLRGYARQVTQATIGLTDLVEAMHDRIARPPVVSAPDPKGRTRSITGFLYKSVRGVTRVVGAGLDAVLARLGSSVALIDLVLIEGA